MSEPLLCPQCGKLIRKHANPAPTTDVIIYDAQKGVVLIERGNEPFGFALPGGFIDEGETVEHAAQREMKEETNLDVELLGILGVYSDPKRDPRFHTMTVTFVGKAKDIEILQAGDDAKKAFFYPLNQLPSPLCFDHSLMLKHFKDFLENKRTLTPIQI